MKNLFVLIQKSILVFALFFLASCVREENILVPSSLPYESLKILKESETTTPPTSTTVDKFDLPGKFRYLTLVDKTLFNTIVIKISTDNADLLNSLNAETVQLITIDKFVPHAVNVEASKTIDLASRSALQKVEIEVIEKRLQSQVRLYGLKFVKHDLIKAFDSYSFVYKNSSVSAVYVSGNYALKDLSRFSAHTSDCPDCEEVFLAPQYSHSKGMLSFIHNKKTDVILDLKAKFSDEFIVLW
jgi:hypothetical protein